MRRATLNKALLTRPSSSLRSLAAQRRAFSRSFSRKDTLTRTPQSHPHPHPHHAITTLPNGIRVATESLPGPFSGIGVYLDAGSRFEDASLSGVSHIIDRLAFKSTHTRSEEQMMDALESLGGTIQCASSRESLMYQSASFNGAVEQTLSLLAETIREPRVTEEEVAAQLAVAEYEVAELAGRPETILLEVVNVAAYGGNTLGNPLLCPGERLGEIDRGTVERYRRRFFRPERVVVAFAGVEHERAVRLTEGLFGDMRGEGPAGLSGPTGPAGIDGGAATGSQSSGSGASTSSASSSTSTSTSASTSPASSQTSPASSSTSSLWPSIKEKLGLTSHQQTRKDSSSSGSSGSGSGSNNINSPFLDTSPYIPSTCCPDILANPAHYTGGFLALDPIPPPANPALPRLSHIHLAFEALPISHPDIYALAALQTLLGGGGSFSAGGPGKGMYSRLYTNVLNQYPWVESCMAFNLSYTDSGLFGIAASCMPNRVMHMLDVMCYEMVSLTELGGSMNGGRNGLQIEEVERAKNQLRSSLLMNLESRMVELEDLGRQVQVQGRRTEVGEMCAMIEKLTVEDVRRVATMVFGGLVVNRGRGTGEPTVVVQEGETEGSRLRRVRWEDMRERIAMWKLGRRN